MAGVAVGTTVGGVVALAAGAIVGAGVIVIVGIEIGVAVGVIGAVTVGDSVREQPESMEILPTNSNAKKRQPENLFMEKSLPTPMSRALPVFYMCVIVA